MAYVLDETTVQQLLPQEMVTEDEFLSPDEEFQACMEIMRENINADADTCVMERYVDNNVSAEDISTILRHLVRCTSCRDNIRSLMEVDEKATPEHRAYRELCEIELRLKQNQARKGFLQAKRGADYRVFIEDLASGRTQKVTATLPAFARYEPEIGEKVFVWESKYGSFLLLGETWDPVRPIFLEEENALPPLSRAERLKPANPFTAQEIAELLAHACNT